MPYSMRSCLGCSCGWDGALGSLPPPAAPQQQGSMYRGGSISLTSLIIQSVHPHSWCHVVEYDNQALCYVPPQLISPADTDRCVNDVLLPESPVIYTLQCGEIRKLMYFFITAFLSFHQDLVGGK